MRQKKSNWKPMTDNLSHSKQLVRQQQRKELKSELRMGKDDSIDHDVFFSQRCPHQHFLCLSNNNGLITAFTQTLYKWWPYLPIQYTASVGGLMEYRSNWPPIKSYGLQVFTLTGTHRWMHTFWNSLPSFSVVALKLSGWAARTVIAPTVSLRYCVH